MRFDIIMVYWRISVCTELYELSKDGRMSRWICSCLISCSHAAGVLYLDSQHETANELLPFPVEVLLHVFHYTSDCMQLLHAYVGKWGMEQQHNNGVCTLDHERKYNYTHKIVFAIYL